jgi:hypothetical protein
MKNIVKVIIIAGFVLYFNISSFAIIDYAAWGGWVFSGGTEQKDKNFDGRQFGIKAHLNTSRTKFDNNNFYIPFIDVGIGAYYQFAKVKSNSGDVLRINSAGLDGNLILLIPFIYPHIQPYVRGTWAFMDKIEYENKSFKSYGRGFGVELTISDSFINTRLFVEYMYDKSKHDIYLKAVNYGLKINLN